MLRNKHLSCVLLIGCFILPNGAKSSNEEAIPVTVKPLGQLVFHPVKKVPAQVVSLQSSLLSAEVSALVEKVHVQIGDQVVKEQLLITLECDDYENNKQLLVAEKQALDAEYNFADYQYQRSKTLLKSNSVSKETHRRQSTEVTRLSAQQRLLQIKIQQSEKTISRCYIKAPYSGVIARRMIHIGENVAPGSPLIKLIDIDNLEVEVQVPVVLVDDLDYLSLNFIYRNEAYPVKLRAIIPSIETRARHQRVRLSFTDKKTLPDAYGMVEITLRRMNISANYLVSRNNQLGLFLIKEKTAEETGNKYFIADFHTLKNALPGRAATIELPLDSRVIIAGRYVLNNGQNVVIQQ
ncbi:MAG: efflux RND transporter periplasmic adaptor subunit [gamma proteobacterium symbiont of Bathyaustriella thionipta]|nr:efflux RND transporter periplasmic adaptor subunit [gamma proteobacterium symbiont of Bathyaustriella thionipta]MCU7951447.1 efflux RND transporter periplasmic adaptor subunit [gamma proteobacterium symbiont of Bathyaustriella thionipta]MCU7952509.1 efflux RND transporter periplasmic adaptor subunit [gamma proteobacterium symbiont of Bathyaustriella thionipta]MCU7958014.1 efflux RND transporter periplasmic adaptor subunit [gamma proteobacterium symbiont of Bathyaustriella thionipta]MCU796639